MVKDNHIEPKEPCNSLSETRAVQDLCPYQLVQLLPTPSAGYGIVASQDIPRGTLIAVEAPLVAIPLGADDDAPAMFCSSLQKLAEEELARLDKCSYDPSALEIINQGNIRKEISGWCQSNIQLNVEGAEFQRAVELACKRYAIFSTNNLSMGENEGRAVFDFFCRMNHSCKPSIHEHYDKQSNRLSIRTLHDIKRGDEIFSTYIDLLHPRKRRRKKLQAWGFTCQCSACADDGMELLRERSIELDDMIEEFLFYLDDPSIPADADDGPFLKNARQALEAGEELVELLDKQGLHGEPIFTAYANICRCCMCNTSTNRITRYRCCSHLSHLAEEVDKALEYALKAREIERQCVGQDHELSDYWGNTNQWIRSLEGRSKGGHPQSRNPQDSLWW